MEDGVTCGSCGRHNRPGRKFCAGCGTPLALACPACGAANEPDEAFCGECGGPLAATPVPERTGVERRLVSVLFADLVGFTTLSEDRDAEDVRDLLSRYFELARTLIERHAGTVEKFIGDAVMAVWGTPAAREDDAERAVRAALELGPAVEALGAEAGLPGLSARAAVLTGEAAVTLGAVGQGMVAGDLVNSASRVQALAEPGSVLVGEATHRSAEAAIAFEDAGVHALKGREEPVRLWRAVRVTAGRGGGLRTGVVEPPFVGRERELRLLKELFHGSAEERRAQLVSVVGIAGIGKSRLAWELQKYLDGLEQTVRWHQGRCLSYGEGVTFWALAEMVRMRAGIAEGEEPEAARAKLRAALELHVDDAEERAWIEPRLAQLLALAGDERSERQDLFGGWRLFFERMAERDPVVLVLEDVQWADAALLEFVEYLLDWSRSHPIFVLALARPEGATRGRAWEPRNATTLALGPLSEQAMGMLLDGFAPGLPEELRRSVLDRAEGVPLYAVETVRMLLDRGLLEPSGAGYRPTRPIEALDVPETLHALVAARLDGLAADERRLVQDASVLGKTFTRRALAAVTAVNEDELDSRLAALVRKELLSQKADPRSPERGQYTFLQDLVRQVAYETLARRERRERHLAAATALERDWVDSEHEVAEIVASHYLAALELGPEAADAASIREKARTTLVQAGARAASLAASASAQRYFEQALELAESPLERAELHERAGRMAELGTRTAAARHHFERAIALFDEAGLGHPAARVTAQLGILTWRQERDLARAVADMERSFEVLAGEERDADLAMLAVQLARALFFAGRADEAMKRNELALEIAESLELPEVLSHGLNTKSLMLSARGRLREAELLLRHSLETATAHDLSEAALRASNNLAVVLFDRDDLRESLAATQESVELARKVGHREFELSNLVGVSAVLYELGQWDDALAVDAELAPFEPEFRVLAQSRAYLCPLFVQRGDRQTARRRIDAAREVADLNEVQVRANTALLEARVLLAEGSADKALARAAAGLEDVRQLPAGAWLLAGLLAVGLDAAFAAGDQAKVDEMLGIVERLAPGKLTPSLRAVGARFSARRAALAGEADSAAAAFAAAARLYREIERPFDIAVVLLEHGEWLVEEGRADEAAPLLAEAGEIFERLRAAPWLERLAAAGAALPEATAAP